MNANGRGPSTPSGPAHAGSRSDPRGPRSSSIYVYVQCREELAQFVRVMEGKLCATDYKKHWRSAFATGEIDFAWLIGRLEDEVRELSASGVGCASPHAIAAECADIANFAMMIADLAMRGEIE